MQHHLTPLRDVLSSMVPPTPEVAIERGHKAGLAAAASAVEAAIHDIDGRWPERSEAYEIARRAVSAYIYQIGQAHQRHGGTR